MVRQLDHNGKTTGSAHTSTADVSNLKGKRKDEIGRASLRWHPIVPVLTDVLDALTKKP